MGNRVLVTPGSRCAATRGYLAQSLRDKNARVERVVSRREVQIDEDGITRRRGGAEDGGEREARGTGLTKSPRRSPATRRERGWLLLGVRRFIAAFCWIEAFWRFLGVLERKRR